MYRKRSVRLRPKLKKESGKETPRSRTRRLLRNSSLWFVKRTLNFHHALVDQMEESSNEKVVRSSISKIIGGKVIRKYRLITHAQNEVKVEDC